MKTYHWFVCALLMGCASDDDPNPSTCGASQAGASGASGQAGASGTSGQAGASGTSGQAGASGTSGQAGASGSGGSVAVIPNGCTVVPGGSPECSGDKKKWLVECPTMPPGCTKHNLFADVYCCQVIQ